MSEGRLLGIARRPASRSPMEMLEEVAIGIDDGLTGDLRGRVAPGRSGRRQIVVMQREHWDAAVYDVGTQLPWTTRRANLLVEGVDLAQRVGDHIVIGDVRLEITGECDPCQRMDEAHSGLSAALAPDWRGGVTTRVINGGKIRLGDEVRTEAA